MHCRKDYYSLGTSNITVSAASHWVATGFTCLMFQDELYDLTKVICLPYLAGIYVGIYFPPCHESNTDTSVI